jgi:hypothetical protein
MPQALKALSVKEFWDGFTNSSTMGKKWLFHMGI